MLSAILVSLVLQTPPLPKATEADFVIKDFKFKSGETLPELRMHYRTLGTPKKDAQGVVRNAVLIMHGTGGSGGGSRRAWASAKSCSCRGSRSTFTWLNCSSRPTVR